MLREILARIRNFEIRIRKAVSGQMRGNFDSVFKGSGLEFADVRAYQYGDDVRRIDWNVSAKGEDTYIKVFREEKEQTIFFLLDVSQSQFLKKKAAAKIQVGKEICSILAFSAVKEGSEVGLICFSDQKEAYVKPDKGIKKGYELFVKLFKLVPQSAKTNLNAFFLFALNLIKRRSIAIIISDFLDTNYEHALKALARKHDLIVIHLIDEQEIELPPLGIVPIMDVETQKQVWVNASSSQFRKQWRKDFEERQQFLETFCRKFSANYLSINTHEDFVPKLVKLFKVRKRGEKASY
ncbi:MAG TPA: DUF58 domain-containing protein [Microscillaceae bacterium]|jgi:uncharacterized protein (DUF58 family)|nr:DUF58 domain-containing protein [Microscillaceae bacterium]